MSATNGQIYTLIPKIMAEVGAIGKDRDAGRDGGPRFKFRGIDDVYNALQPVLAANGVFFVPKVLKRDREERTTQRGGVMTITLLDMEFTFYAPDGSSIVAVTTGEAMDSSDKSCNKAMSAALKYALFDVFCIPTEEPKDSENDNPLPPPRQPQRTAQQPASTLPFLDQLEAALAERGMADSRCLNGLKAALDEKAKAKGSTFDFDNVKPQTATAVLKQIKDGKFDYLKEPANV